MELGHSIGKAQPVIKRRPRLLVAFLALATVAGVDESEAGFPKYAYNPKVRVSLAEIIAHVEIEAVEKYQQTADPRVGRALARCKVLSVLKGEAPGSIIAVRFSTTTAENPRFLPWQQYIVLLTATEEEPYRLVFGFLGTIQRVGPGCRHVLTGEDCSGLDGEGLWGLDGLRKLSWPTFLSEFRKFIDSQPDGQTRKLLEKIK